MTKTIIEKLLAGAKVEWQPLGDLIISNTGGGTPSKAISEYWNGKIPWASVGDLSIDGNYIKKTRHQISAEGLKNSSTNIIKKGNVIVAIKISPGKMKIAGVDLAINQDLRGLKLNEWVIPPYLNYYFETFKIRSNGTIVKSIISKDIEKINIPVPPLSVQKKIVRILDAFTALTTELTAELTAELNDRQKQYNYYRDKLLTFSDDEVEWKKLGDIACYSNSRIRYQALTESNYVGVDNLKQNRGGKNDSKFVPKMGNFQEYLKGDILIGNIRPYLKKIWLSNQAGGASGDILVIRVNDNKIYNKYLYQILSDDKFFNYYIQYSKGAKMPRGDKKAVLDYILPIPSLERQKQIVSILDKFEALTTSITEGLPREIELRNKQYEYYRDQLLNFPKPEEKAEKQNACELAK